MSCKNEVSFYVPRGYDYREVKIKCGNTDPHGGRTICEKCEKDPAEMERIRQHEKNVDADNAWARSAGWGEF